MRLSPDALCTPHLAARYLPVVARREALTVYHLGSHLRPHLIFSPPDILWGKVALDPICGGGKTQGQKGQGYSQAHQPG